MAGTSELPSRMDTDGFRPLTEQGVLAAVQEHMQLLCTTIMSLDSNENSPEGRKVAQLANDAIMSIASWGTKTREECKEEDATEPCPYWLRPHRLLSACAWMVR